MNSTLSLSLIIKKKEIFSEKVNETFKIALRGPQVFSVYNLIDLDVVNRGKQAFDHLEQTLTRAKPVAMLISSIL